MLPQKQTCLARNRIGMTCNCLAISNGRCRFHSPVLSGAAPRIEGETLGSAITRGVMHSLDRAARLHERFLPRPARLFRQTPVAFALRGHAA